MVHPHTFLRFPGGLEKAVSFTFDDGTVEDRRVADRMGELGLRGTFNINSGWFGRKTFNPRLTAEETVEALDRDFVEIACHGAFHVDPTRVDASTFIWDVMRDRDALEKLFRRPITGFAYPQSAFTKDAMELLERLGFEYARAGGGSEFRLPKNCYELRTTCHLLSGGFDEYAEKFLPFRCSDDLWWDSADAQFFNIFCHSYEISGKGGRWETAFRHMEAVAGHSDIWYATNIEVIRYIRAYRALVFSLERGSVYNPSCRTVWFRHDGGIGSVGPGETAAF